MEITQFQHQFKGLPAAKYFWKSRNVSRILPVHLPLSSCRSRSRKHVVVAAADGSKKPPQAEEEEFLLNRQQMMELEFGRLLREDPKKTLAKVIGRKLNPDASHLDIEKSMEGRSSVRLKHRLRNSLIDAEERQLQNFSNSKSISRNNTGKGKSVDRVRRVVRREGKGVISPAYPTRPDHHTKALSEGSDSKNNNHEVLLRKPASPETRAQAWQGKEVVSPTGPKRLGGHAKAFSKDSDSLDITHEVLLQKPSSPGTKARGLQGNGFASLTDPNRLGSDTKSLSTGSNSKNIIHDVLLRKPSPAKKSRGFAFQHKTPLSLSITKDNESEKDLEDAFILRRPEAMKSDNSLSKKSSDLEVKVVISRDSSGSETDCGNTDDAEQKSINERGDLKGEREIPLTRPTFPTNPNALRDDEMDAKISNRYMEHKLYHGMIVSQKKEDASSSSSKETQDTDDIAPIPAKSDNMFKPDINISVMFPVPPVKLESQETIKHSQDCREDEDVEEEAQHIQQTTGIESVPLNLEASVPTGSSVVDFYKANTVKRKSIEHIDSSGCSLVSEVARQDNNDTHNVTDTGLDLAYSAQQLTERTYRDGADDVSNEKVHRPSLANSVLRKPLHQMEPCVNHINGEEFERNAKISDQNNEAFSWVVKEGKDHDWANAETLHKSGVFAELELLSCNETSFSVLFGSLLGFLPYRDLGPRRRPLPFENWLQQKGYDLPKFQKGMGTENITYFDKSILDLVSTTFPKNEETIQSEENKSAAVMTKEYQNLLNLYNQDKTRFLSSFVGQKTRAVVTFVDVKSGRLLFSENPRRTRNAEKKATLMGKLNIGDVVTCQVAKIESFGVFVELEGVSALIHQSELSWDPLWDVNSNLKVGEVVKAKVCSLDCSRQRINLSLKQLKPDPLLGTLESIVNEEDDHKSCNLETGELGKEWPEVESLIRELELVNGIQSVSKGRFLLTPGLAPSFQVYLSDSYGDQYKILARSGNKVQEIVVKASLDRDEVKSAIGLCTSQVALEIGQ